MHIVFSLVTDNLAYLKGLLQVVDLCYQFESNYPQEFFFRRNVSIITKKHVKYVTFPYGVISHGSIFRVFVKYGDIAVMSAQEFWERTPVAIFVAFVWRFCQPYLHKDI